MSDWLTPRQWVAAVLQPLLQHRDLLSPAGLGALGQQLGKLFALQTLALVVPGEGEVSWRLFAYRHTLQKPFEGAWNRPLLSLDPGWQPDTVARWVEDQGQEEPLLSVLRSLGLQSCTLVPLQAGPDTTGLLLLSGSEQGPCVPLEALEMLGEVLGSFLTLVPQAPSHAPSQPALPADSSGPATQPEGSLVPAHSQLLWAGQVAILGTLAGGLVHEINNPATYLALAAGQVEKLVNKGSANGATPSLEVLSSFASGIAEATSQIRSVVTNYRLLASITSKSSMVTVDMERLILAALSLTKASYRHDAQVDTDIEPMAACPGRLLVLGPVLVGLIANALQSFHPDATEKRVKIEARGSEHRVMIRVSDTGAGIAKELLPRVFEPFFTTHRDGRHAGLGLNTAQATVQALGGQIQIDSQVGQGTTVELSVPLS